MDSTISTDELSRYMAETQRQLDSLKRQVLESQRLATIGTISAVIAHEFNNLLTPIVSYSQYALKSAESDKPDMAMIAKALNKAFGAATKAGRICQSMLSLARGEDSVGEVAVQELIDQTLLVMARDPQKDAIALRVQVQPGTSVQGDAIQLEQVLLNLLINARGRRMLKARRKSLTIKAAAVENTAEVKIQIIDTGSGIAEKNLAKIFDPFFSTKGTAKRGEAKGTGLGLAICKEIIEHHAGRIDVQSEVSKGTTFTLYLPSA